MKTAFTIKDNMVGTARVRQITPVSLKSPALTLVPSAALAAPARKAHGKHLKSQPAPESKGPRRQDREGEEQTELITQFEATYPAYAELLIHIPNGGYRKNAFEGFRLRAQGVRKGVSDLFLPIARGGFFGLWIEFKAAPPYASKVSRSQQVWIDRMLAQGYHAQVCKGTPAAMDALDAYLALPPTLCSIQPRKEM